MCLLKINFHNKSKKRKGGTYGYITEKRIHLQFDDIDNTANKDVSENIQLQ